MGGLRSSFGTGFMRLHASLQQSHLEHICRQPAAMAARAKVLSSFSKGKREGALRTVMHGDRL
jgi:hypothetical protein